MKQGIVVVNHGTMDFDVRSRTIEDFMLSIGDRNPEADIVEVFTDGNIRRSLRELTGEKVQNLKAAILGMKERGVTDLVVVLTDIYESDECRRIKEETAGLAPLFRNVGISAPLISSESDYEITARAMHGAFGELVGEDSLILIAEGHKSDGSQELKMFENALQKHIENGYVASLHGDRKIYKIIRDMKGRGIEGGRVVFVPMVFMAGEKVENEVSQEYTDLVLRLEEEGYSVESHFRGLAEYDAFQRLYMRHFYDALR